MSLVHEFKNSQYKDCIVHECLQQGCTKIFQKDRASLRLANSPAPHILIDCDKPPMQQGKKRCDFIFVASREPDAGEYTLPIEMTSGYKDISDAQSQLQAGAEIVSEISSPSTKIIFIPVLIGKLKEMKLQKQKDFRKKHPIEFRGKKSYMKIIGQRENLVKALST